MVVGPFVNLQQPFEGPRLRSLSPFSVDLQRYIIPNEAKPGLSNAAPPRASSRGPSPHPLSQAGLQPPVPQIPVTAPPPISVSRTGPPTSIRDYSLSSNASSCSQSRTLHTPRNVFAPPSMTPLRPAVGSPWQRDIGQVQYFHPRPFLVPALPLSSSTVVRSCSSGPVTPQRQQGADIIRFSSVPPSLKSYGKPPLPVTITPRNHPGPVSPRLGPVVSRGRPPPASASAKKSLRPTLGSAGLGKCTPGTPKAVMRTPDRKRTGSTAGLIAETKQAVGTPKPQFRQLAKGDIKLTRQPSRPGEADPGIDYVGYLASLNWLRKHNMLYGIELADSSDTKHWYAMHGTAPQDRDVDPWGHERLREHLDRIWNRELEARKRAACPVRMQSPMVARMRTTPVRKAASGNGDRPMVVVGKPQLSPIRHQQQQQPPSRVAHSLPPTTLRGQDQQAPKLPVPVQEARPLFLPRQMPVPRFELGTKFSFPPVTTMLPRMTGAAPPPVAGRSVISGGPPVAEGARIRSVSLNPPSLHYPMSQMAAPRLAQPPFLTNQAFNLKPLGFAPGYSPTAFRPAWLGTRQWG